MDCLLETKVDVTLEGETGVDSGCKYDCRGQIIISVGSGVLVGALLVAVGRWAIRYMVMGIVYFILFIFFLIPWNLPLLVLVWCRVVKWS